MSRLKASWDAFQARLTKSVETISRSPTVRSRQSAVDEIDLASNLAEYYDLFEATPLIHSSIRSFSSDVVSPGYRIQGEDDNAVEYLQEWAEQAAIVAGEKHKDLLPFLKQAVNQRWGRGGAMIEHVKDDPDSSDYDITGVHYIRPETVNAVTHQNRNILVAPDETDQEDATTTPRGEAAAFIQYADDALLGPFSDKDPIPLSQNDVTRSLLNPDIDALWGTPVTQPIAEDVKGFKEILRANEQAIKGKAWGVWSIGFGREVVETPDYVEVVEWSDDDQDEFLENEIDDLDPGEIVGHDGQIELEKHEGEVPDIIDHLDFYVSNITTALPTPLYVVGFEKNINQFVTEKQDKRYQKLIREEREALERDFSPLLREVIERNTDYSTEGIRLKLEPEEDASPIRSLESEEIDKIQTFADALNKLSGTADPATLVDDEAVRDLILQLPEDTAPGPSAEVDEGNPEVQAQAEELANMANGDGQAD